MQKENKHYFTIQEISKKTKINQGKLYAITHYDRLECEAIGGRIVVDKKVYEEWAKTNLKPKEGAETFTKEAEGKKSEIASKPESGTKKVAKKTEAQGKS